MVGWWWVGGLCDFSVSPSPFGLEFGTLDFGTLDSGLTIAFKLFCKLSRYFFSIGEGSVGNRMELLELPLSVAWKDMSIYVNMLIMEALWLSRLMDVIQSKVKYHLHFT